MEQGKGKKDVDTNSQGIFEPMNISTDSLELSRNLPQVIDTNSETSNSFLLELSTGPALVGTASLVDSPALESPTQDGDAKDSVTPTGRTDRQGLDDNREIVVDADGLDHSLGPVLLRTASSTESPAVGGGGGSPMREDGDAKDSVTPTGPPDRQSLIDNRETVEYADGLARELLNSTHNMDEMLTNQSAAIGEEKDKEEEEEEEEGEGDKEETQLGEVDAKDEKEDQSELLEKEEEEEEKVEEAKEEIKVERRISIGEVEEEKKPDEEKVVEREEVDNSDDDDEIKEEKTVEELEEEKILDLEEAEGIEEVKTEVFGKKEIKVEREEPESGDQKELKEIHHNQQENDKIVEEIQDNSTVKGIEVYENSTPIADTQVDYSPPPPPPLLEPTPTIAPKVEEDTQQQDFHESSQTEAEAADANNLLLDCENKLDEEMEFTKNYSDDLLMGQSDSGAEKGETMMPSADLADFELPPYSGSSSSGSEPPRQHSPVKRQSSSNSSAAQPTSSHQANTETSSSPNLSAVKNLLMSSYCRVSHILHWKRPIETGIIFAVGVTLIITLTFFSIISVFAYSALGVILASALIRSYKAITKALNRSSDLPFDHLWNKIQGLNVSMSPEKTHELVDLSLGNLNASLLYFKQVLLFEDKIATFKSGLFLYLLTYIGAWFNGMTLITICYLALFSVPIFYEINKTKIDQYLKLATGQLSSTISLVSNKATSLAFGGSSSPPTSGGASSKKQN